MKLFSKSCILLLLGTQAIAQSPSINEQEKTVTISNDLIAVSFNKTNADLTSIQTKNGVQLLGKQGRGYLLGPGFSMFPSTFKLLRKTDDLVEIAFNNPAKNHFTYELHYVLRKGIPGIYCFLVQSHKASDSMGTYGQTRWGIRAEESLFDYHLVRDSIQGPMPKMAELQQESEIQDWTYKMADGTVYTKYNYADYIEDRHVHGMAGERSGFGLFVIQASHEYLNGGPTKQYQNVHSNPYLICMFNCGHFLSDIRKGDDKISDDWVKLDGPFLLYVNEGKSIPEIWANAKQQSEKEIRQWPYTWMQHPEYPLERGELSGRLLLNGKPVAAGTHIILADRDHDWQAQSRGYDWYTKTDDKAGFRITAIRPGSYTLYAYGNNEIAEFRKDNLEIKAGLNQAGTLNWNLTANGKLAWQIGKADRRTTGFKLADHKRSYGVFNEVPANLTYIVGKSVDSTGWYYAQTKPGKWDIVFNYQPAGEKKCYLTIAMAGVAKNPLMEVYVNDQKTDSFNKLGNDASIYRSAIAGGYYQEHLIEWDASLLKPGSNKISLSLPNVKEGGGIMYDAIKLEMK